MTSSRSFSYILTLSLLLSPFYSHCQDNPYFQQEVHYWIDVALNDKTHELQGNINIEYNNNSPDTLTAIYFHLWPNAYDNLQTAFADQQLENGSTRFYYSEKEERGYIDGLDFKVDGTTTKWQLDRVHIDFGVLTLNQPLLPGEFVTITTPFHVKIPESFSRLGHVGESYQITQWYPKPAVYDKDGWHPMPYLDQGEFYSEYGNFEVKITLPKNYVVGASGYLQNEEEKQWLRELALKPINFNDHGNEFPKSDSETKTLHYQLNNAHDFAWFADKRFNVRSGKVELPNSGRKVETWVMFTDMVARTWGESINYVNDALYYYSLWIGDYPDSVMTVVEGALSAGAGMEYPTITIVGGESSEYMLERVIVHETGHNWFYGYLGSNERAHPWMDEGINSYYENRYFDYKYKDNRVLCAVPGISRFLDLDHFTYNDVNELSYILFARGNKDQPIELPSAEYTYFNYGAIVYSKAAIAMKHLEGYLGAEAFDKGMQQYFEQWKFHHPQPTDLQTIMEEVSGKDLEWFFVGLLQTTQHVNYAIAKVTHEEGQATQIKVKNKGHLIAPFSISSIDRDSVLHTQWYVGCEKDTTVTFNGLKGTHYRIDALEQTTEYNRQNDIYRNRGLMKKVEPLRFQLFGSVNNPEKSQLFFTPILGWNHYDKLLVGMAFYNHTIVPKRFEFELAPMLGTGPVTFSGMGRMGYNWNPQKGKLRNINLSVYGKRFAYDLYPFENQYNKLQPQLTFNIRKKDPRSSFTERLILRSVNIWQQFTFFDQMADAYAQSSKFYYVNEARYELENDQVINPYNFTFAIEQANDFMKIAAFGNFQITYNQPNKGLFIRIFAGGFPWHDRPGTGSTEDLIPDARLRLNFGTSLESRQKDYMYDELFLGRNETEGLLSQQVAIKDGGFRSPLNIGQTGKWLTSVNINSTIPGPIPIRPYMGFAFFGADGNAPVNILTAFELGLGFFVIPEVLEINFPLVILAQIPTINDKRALKWYPGISKDDGDNVYRQQKYWNLITFRFNIKPLNPFNVVDEFVF